MKKISIPQRGSMMHLIVTRVNDKSWINSWHILESKASV